MIGCPTSSLGITSGTRSRGGPDIVVDPDVFVAFGRPKGHRRSYLQWREGGVAPQVVFEVISSTTTLGEMMDKAVFYARHGVEEVYVYDPDNNTGWGYVSDRMSEDLHDWVSPRLGIRFDLSGTELVVYDAHGQRFEAPGELRKRAEEEAAKARAEGARAEAEAARAEAEAARADREAERARRLADMLRAAGIDPEA